MINKHIILHGLISESSLWQKSDFRPSENWHYFSQFGSSCADCKKVCMCVVTVHVSVAVQHCWCPCYLRNVFQRILFNCP